MSANSWYDNGANMGDDGPSGNLKATVINGGTKVVGIGAVNQSATAVQSAAVAVEAMGAGSSAVNGGLFSIGTGGKATTRFRVPWAGRLFIPSMVAATYANQKAAEACGCTQ